MEIGWNLVASEKQFSFGYQYFCNPIGYMKDGIVYLGEPIPVRPDGCDPFGYLTMDEITEPGFYRIVITGDMTVVFDGQAWRDDFIEVYEDTFWIPGSGDFAAALFDVNEGIIDG